MLSSPDDSGVHAATQAATELLITTMVYCYVRWGERGSNSRAQDHSHLFFFENAYVFHIKAVQYKHANTTLETSRTAVPATLHKQPQETKKYNEALLGPCVQRTLSSTSATQPPSSSFSSPPRELRNDEHKAPTNLQTPSPPWALSTASVPIPQDRS